MELLWIVFITFVAMVFAYFLGGAIDRRAWLRQHEEERERRESELACEARFCHSFAGELCAASLADPENEGEIAEALARHVFAACGETLSPEEFSRLMSEFEPVEKIE